MIKSIPMFQKTSEEVVALSALLVSLAGTMVQDEHREALLKLADALPGLEQSSLFAVQLAKATVGNPRVPEKLQSMLAASGTFAVVALDVLYDGVDAPDVQHNLAMAESLVGHLNLLAEMNGVSKPEKAEVQKPNLTLVH